MKKRISVLVAVLLLEFSSILSIVAGTIGFNNASNNIGSYISSLLKNPYDSLIAKANGNLNDQFNKEEYSKPLETRVGLYSEDIKANVFEKDTIVSLVKTNKYEFDQYYNDFGVLSSYVGGGQQSWKELNNNSCFISRQFALLLAKENSISEEDVLNKKINISDKTITISGIYYTNINSQEQKEISTRGNIFYQTFNNCVFVSKDFDCNGISFNSFLYLQGTTKIDNANTFFEFRKTSKEMGFQVRIYDYIGSYHLDNEIDSKINGLESYYSISKTVFSVIMILIALFLLTFSMIVLVKFKFFIYLKLKSINAFFLLFLLFLILNLVLVKSLYLVTSDGAKVALNNPVSVSLVSFIYLVFMAFYIIEIKKRSKKDKEYFIDNNITNYIIMDI